MDKSLLNLYATYLQISSSQITATGLSELLEQSLSHDKITWFLSSDDYGSEDLYACVKSEVRYQESLQSSDAYGVLIVDDFVSEKKYSSENEMIAWHYDHSEKRSVKGINQVSIIYDINDNRIPVGFDLVYKTKEYFNKKKGEICRKSPETKNEKLRKLVGQAYANGLKFKYVLADSWYCSKENMNFIKRDCKRDFILACPSNRSVALSAEQKEKGDYQDLASLSWQEEEPRRVWIQGLDFPVLALRQVFKNGDESTGERYLLCSELSLDYSQITTIYKRRWKVEEHHRVLQSNLGYAKAPLHTKRTLSNHCFACLYAFFDQQRLIKKMKINHYQLKNKIYINALKKAYQQIVSLKNDFSYA